MSKSLKWILKLLAGILLMTWVYRSSTVPIALMEISEIRFSLVGVFFAIAVTNSFLSALKWWWTLRVDGVSMSLRKLFVSYLIGGFLNLFLPSNIGGDSYRIASLGKGRMLKSAASVVADRLSGLLALSTLGASFAFVSRDEFTHPLVVLMPGMLLIMLVVLVCALFFSGPTRWLLRALRLDRLAPIRKLSDSLFASFASYRQSPRLLTGMLVISFAFQFFYIAAIYVLARALRIDEIPFGSYCVFVPVVAILEAIPVSFYGLGLRDAGYLAFFTEVGLNEPRAHAMSLSMLYLGLTVFYVAIGGALLLVRMSREKATDVSDVAHRVR